MTLPVFTKVPLVSFILKFSDTKSMPMRISLFILCRFFLLYPKHDLFAFLLNIRFVTGIWKPIKPGEVTLTIMYEQEACSVCHLLVVQPEEATKCTVCGDGLQQAIVGEKATFTASMKVIACNSFPLLTYLQNML